ncbi:hypothetical protein ACJX0J_039718, partial [Zea mays]
SINATGRIQNAEFIYDCIRDVSIYDKHIFNTSIFDRQDNCHTNLSKRLKYILDGTLIVAGRDEMRIVPFMFFFQYAFFCEKRGLFAGEEAERSATNGWMSAGIYLTHYYAFAYGGENKELQMLARRI